MDDSRRNVNLKIADKSYKLVARDDDDEHYMRLAADRINELYNKFNLKFTDVQPIDKLAFVALNLTVAYLRTDEAKKDIETGVKQVSEDLKTYLTKINNR